MASTNEILIVRSQYKMADKMADYFGTLNGILNGTLG
jgi:hypothetical protein